MQRVSAGNVLSTCGGLKRKSLNFFDFKDFEEERALKSGICTEIMKGCALVEIRCRTILRRGFDQ